MLPKQGENQIPATICWLKSQLHHVHMTRAHMHVLKNIAIYATKVEGKSNTCHHMMSRITATSCPHDPTSDACHCLQSEAIVD